MTAEIVLMNRHAVALAADSAVTISYWSGSEKKERYFKGANKIFNLSEREPVALMIYDAADLQGVPWEVIAKTFREHLGITQFDSLNEYATSFFEFLEHNEAMHPRAVRVQQFLSDLESSAHFLLFLLDRDNKISKTEDREARIALATPKWANIGARLHRAPPINEHVLPNIDAILAEHGEVIRTRLEASGPVDHYVGLEVVSLDELTRWAIAALYRKKFSILGSSGIVITGFGGKDYFPKLAQFLHYGMILGRSLFTCEEQKSITHENASEVLPLAQSEMADTFINGASGSMLRDIEATLTTCSENLEASLIAGGHLVPGADIKPIIAEAKEAFGSELVNKLINSHTAPMKSVVGMLPIDELADLAEILIRIESLKERVTRESEQVGGPIDVAVISRGDGFIWIKRKHYFDPQLNPRYIARKAAQ